ncbi:MAG: YHYH domain-containing protein [Enterocloster bolteae]
MKRTVKIWLAAVMSGVLLAGGAAMTGQAPWGMEAQAHSGRTDASGGHRDNKNASGLGSYHYHCGGHPAHLHPNGVCPYAGGGESTQTQTRAQTKPRHKPRLRHRPRHRPRRRLRPRLRTRLRPGQLPGQEKLPVLRAGIRMGHTGTISARTEPV